MNRFYCASVFCFMLSGSTAIADIVSFTTIADARLFDTGANGSFETLDTGNLTMSIRNFATLGSANSFEERSVAEFNLSTLPAGASIGSVTFQFDTRSFANSNTRVDIFGYQGDGLTTLSDATTSAVLLGSYDPVALGLGMQSVSLNTAPFATLLATSPLIGLRFQGIESTNTQFSSLEGSGILNTIAPTLTVNTNAVPEPGSVALIGLGLVAAPLAIRRQRRRAC